MRAALTVAGSDSGGGAGVQADLKTFAAFGIHGLSAITAATAQTPAGIADTHVLPPAIVTAQIAAAADGFPVAAAKTGMLSNGAIVDAVCRAFEALGIRPVVDPVLASTGGSRLLDRDGIRRLIARLLPLAAVATPNRMEAERLSGIAVTSLATAREAARRLLDLGPAAVIVTGGHLDEPADTVVDVLDDGTGAVEIATPRVAAGDGRAHGTGCTFSAALTAGLAAGGELAAAAADAQRYVAAAIRRAQRVGGGGFVLDHTRPQAASAGRRAAAPTAPAPGPESIG